MHTENRKKIAAILFANNLEVKKYFFTSDDQAFTVESMADAHSASLEDKTVYPFEERDLDQPTSSPVSQGEKVKSGTQKTAGQDTDEANIEKAAKAALKPQYVELFGKNPAPQYDSAKIKSLIAEEKARVANDQAQKAADSAAGQSGTTEIPNEA